MTSHSQIDQSSLDNIATEEFVINNFGDAYLYSLNGNAFNRFGADTLFLETYGDSIFQENRLYFFIGSDSALLPAYIERKGIPKGSRYIFIEPPQIVDKIASIKKKWSEKIIFSPPDDALNAAEKQSTLGALYYALSSKLMINSSLASHNIANSFYTTIKASINDQLNAYWRAAHTVYSTPDSKLHIEAAFINSVDTYRSALFLRKLTTFTSNKTAIVLTGGPSLDLFIDWVEKIKNDVVLIAASRITEKLKAKGITPDIVVACDPQNISLAIGKGLFLDYTPLLVSTSTTAPDIIAQWPGKLAIIGEKLPYISTTNHHDNIGICTPTVTNIAVNIAVEIGVAQVILLGADFCFTAEGSTHASGVGVTEAPLTVGRDIIEVTTNEGCIAPTAQELVEARDSLEIQAEEYTARGVKLVTPAPNAARIQNIEFCAIENINIQPLTCLLIAEIEKIYPKANRDRHLHELKEKLTELDYKMDNIMQLAKTGEESIEALWNSDGGQYRQLLALIKGIKSRISSDTTYQLLNKYGKYELAEIASCLDSGESSRNITLESHRMLFCTFSNISSEIKELIADALQRLDSRLEEIKPNPDISALAEQWRKDKQPGRAKVFRVQNPDLASQITTKDQQLLNELEAEFLRTLPHIKKDDQLGIDGTLALKLSIPKIILHYNTHNIDRLIRLNKAINKNPDKDRTLYSLLVQGIIHELNLDYDKALLCFSKITGSNLPLVASLALEHTVTIAMNQNDHQTALLAMKQLVQISDKHLPHLAELFDSIGCTTEAIQVLEQHIQKNPRNLPAIIKIAHLMFETNDLSGAKHACQQALELDSNLAQIDLLLSKIDISAHKKPS